MFNMKPRGNNMMGGFRASVGGGMGGGYSIPKPANQSPFGAKGTGETPSWGGPPTPPMGGGYNGPEQSTGPVNRPDFKKPDVGMFGPPRMPPMMPPTQLPPTMPGPMMDDPGGTITIGGGETQPGPMANFGPSPELMRRLIQMRGGM